MNVTTDTITSWELNRNEPTVTHIPKIISFLGYSPIFHQNPVVNYRIQNGLTQKELARILKIDPTTLLKIEKGRVIRMSKEVRMKLDCLF